MLMVLLGLSCNYYSPPIIDIQSISIPKAEHAYAIHTNMLMQDLRVSVVKMEHWINKNCYARGDAHYHPITGEEILKDIEKRDIPPRFFAPLTITIRGEQIFVGKEEVTENKEPENQPKERGVKKTIFQEEYIDLVTEIYDNKPSRKIWEPKTGLPNLYQVILEKRNAYHYFLEQCAPYYNIEASGVALLVVESEARQDFLKRVLLTLMGAGVDSVAFYVDDASPSKKRSAKQVGGIVSGLSPKDVENCEDCVFEVDTHTAVFSLNPDRFVWTNFRNEQQEKTELPKNLGENFVPKADLLLDQSSSVSSLFRYHDALAGAGVFCTKWKLEDHATQEWKAVAEKNKKISVQIQRNMTIPVHLVRLFETGQDVFQREDGIHCFRAEGIMDLWDNEIHKHRRLNEIMEDYQ